MVRKILVLIILISVQFSSVFARAGFSGGGFHGGGGFSHSSSGGYHSYNGVHYYGHSGRGIHWQSGDEYFFYGMVLIMLLVICYFYFGKKLMIKTKVNSANKLLKNSVLQDKIWDKESMILFTRIAYLRMQDAWKNQDVSLVKDILTKSCIEKTEIEFRTQAIAGYYNFIHKVKISKIEIIGIQDFENDSYDKFSAYITGTMIDENVNYGNTEPKYGNENKFEDIYYFVRNENSWLLDDIDNEVSIETFLAILNKGQ